MWLSTLVLWSPFTFLQYLIQKTELPTPLLRNPWILHTQSFFVPVITSTSGDGVKVQIMGSQLGPSSGVSICVIPFFMHILCKFCVSPSQRGFPNLSIRPTFTLSYFHTLKHLYCSHFPILDPYVRNTNGVLCFCESIHTRNRIHFVPISFIRPYSKAHLQFPIS